MRNAINRAAARLVAAITRERLIATIHVVQYLVALGLIFSSGSEFVRPAFGPFLVGVLLWLDLALWARRPVG